MPLADVEPADTLILTLDRPAHKQVPRQLRRFQENHAAILHGQNKLRSEPGPQLTELQLGKVRMCLKAVRICRTDIHLSKRVTQCFSTSQASVYLTFERRSGMWLAPL